MKPLYAIGDLHGNIDAFRQIARELGIADENMDWKAPGIDLVQIGDICDRGTDSRSIYETFMKWQAQAEQYDSSVYVLLGNHEVMNMCGHHDYATEQERDGFVDHPRAFARNGWLHRWLVQQHAMLQIRDLVFCHADLPPSLVQSTVPEIDGSVLQAIEETAPHAGERVKVHHPLLFSEDESPLWSRVSSRRRLASYAEDLQRFLARHNAQAYICGHTPDERGRFTVKWSGSYVCIDTGMAFENYGMGGRSALLFEAGELHAIYFRDGKQVRARIRSLS